MLIKAEDYILCWLTHTPLIAMIVTGDDGKKVFDVSVDCIPKRSVGVGLYRTVTKHVLS